MDNLLEDNDQDDAFIAELIKLNMSHLIEEAEEVRVNAILLNGTATSDNEIPIGATKIGGHPDLPPEISYPIMASFTKDIREKEFLSERQFRFAKTGEETIPETTMRFIAQINLSEVSPYDRDGFLPKTGMLYFFWGGKYDGPERYDKVIYYDGNAELTRTAPPLPHYIGEAFDEEPLPVTRCSFKTAYEYNLSGENSPWNFDTQFEELDGLLEISDFQEYGTRLFGVPCGGNVEAPSQDWLNLLWLDYHIGCLWNVYWRIKKDDLLKRNFDNVSIDFDID
jgi:hypothetical protein